ncbi:serine protein kinase [Candidatus Epulonipiscioides gigas]|nr:serine protein kinase [Epulopiscium sp. SCG-C07WGA-EpuloA2]
MDFLKLIEDTRNQNNSSKELKINFLEYLNILKKDNTVYKLSHQRIYEELKNKVLKDSFFGIDQTLKQIIEYFFSAAHGGEEARQILYLVGPVGSGKSSLIELIKKTLEKSSEIYHLEDCPMREEPLHLLPRQIRAYFEKILGIKIEGELCPKCRHRLIHEFDNKYENFPIKKSKFSIAKRQGIGVVPPVDANNQDISILIGSINISKMDVYEEDDPRVFSLNGAFHVANRGIIEFIEVFKNDVEYLYTMLTATQEKLIPSPARGEMLYFDGVILAHSNEAEWIRFKSDKTNEAILDRIVKVDVPYCLILDEEIKIYEKLLSQTTFYAHIAPHTLKTAAQFAILTRLLPSHSIDIFTKLKIYNNESVDAKIDIEELKQEHEDEGMRGVSIRFIMKVFGNAFYSCNGCITPIHFFKVLSNEIKKLLLPSETKKQYIDFLETYIKKDYYALLEEDITKAFICEYNKQAQTIFDIYIDMAENFLNNKEINEQFMREIEEEIDISKSAIKGFRQDVVSFVRTKISLGEIIPYSCHLPLKKAIEKKLMNSLKELTRIIKEDNIKNFEEKQKYNEIINKLIKDGYCEICAKETLEYLQRS